MGKLTPADVREHEIDSIMAATIDDDTQSSVAARIVDLRVAILAVSQDEPSFLAWRNLLEAELVPYDVIVVGADPLTCARLQHSPDYGRYQAIVLTTDSLLRQEGSLYVSALTAEEWTLLRDYQRSFGIRQVSAYATPSPAHGLTSPTAAGDVGETLATLTAPGRTVFPQLRGPVPLSPGTYGFVTRASEGADFNTLVVGTDGSPVVGVMTHDDGREELVVTVASGAHSEHMHLLGHGILNWVTQGGYLGSRKYYLSVHVDDVLLSAQRPAPPDGGSAETIRMEPVDVLEVAAWCKRSGVRLDLTYNGWGEVSATASGTPDRLAEALREHSASFGWINHTFGHRDLDHASYEEICTEIAENFTWAKQNDIVVEPDGLVTGAHSGLRNPELGRALDRFGVRWVASDASRPDQADPSMLGRARAVPRHPINIPLNVTKAVGLQATQSAALNLATAGTSSEVSAQDVHQTEARLMLGHIMGNDPRPHFAHQNALTDERLLLELIDLTLASYGQVLSAPLTRPTLAEAGEELRRREQWRALVERGGLTATLGHDRVEIVNLTDQTIEVPITRAGRTAEDSYWVTIEPGASLVS